jgi:hypothetical protein
MNKPPSVVVIIVSPITIRRRNKTTTDENPFRSFTDHPSIRRVASRRTYLITPPKVIDDGE